jgi:hypothetical protein
MREKGKNKEKKIRRGLTRRLGRPGSWLDWTSRRRLKNEDINCQWIKKCKKEVEKPMKPTFFAGPGKWEDEDMKISNKLGELEKTNERSCFPVDKSVMNSTCIHLRVRGSNIYMYRRRRIYKKNPGEIQ